MRSFLCLPTLLIFWLMSACGLPPDMPDMRQPLYQPTTRSSYCVDGEVLVVRPLGLVQSEDSGGSVQQDVVDKTLRYTPTAKELKENTRYWVYARVDDKKVELYTSDLGPDDSCQFSQGNRRDTFVTTYLTDRFGKVVLFQQEGERYSYMIPQPLVTDFTSAAPLVSNVPMNLAVPMQAKTVHLQFLWVGPMTDYFRALYKGTNTIIYRGRVIPEVQQGEADMNLAWSFGLDYYSDLPTTIMTISALSFVL